MGNEVVTVLMAIGLFAGLVSFIASERRRRVAKRKLDTWRRGVEDWRR